MFQAEVKEKNHEINQFSLSGEFKSAQCEDVTRMRTYTQIRARRFPVPGKHVCVCVCV